VCSALCASPYQFEAVFRCEPSPPYTFVPSIMLTSFADNQNHRVPFDIFKLPQRESRMGVWSPLQISSYGSFVLYKLVCMSRSLAWQSCVTRACPLRTPARPCIATSRATLLPPTARGMPWMQCGLTTKSGMGVRMRQWLRQPQQPGWFALGLRRVVRPQAMSSLRRSPAGPHRPLLPLAVHQAPGLVAAPESARL